MKQYLDILGLAVLDRVTGFEGIATSVSFDLYGCVQVVVVPKKNEENKAEGKWFDHKRLLITGTDPIMDVPTFTMVPGGQSLPSTESSQLH